MAPVAAAGAHMKVIRACESQPLSRMSSLAAPGSESGRMGSPWRWVSARGAEARVVVGGAACGEAAWRESARESSVGGKGDCAGE